MAVVLSSPHLGVSASQELVWLMPVFPCRVHRNIQNNVVTAVIMGIRVLSLIYRVMSLLVPLNCTHVYSGHISKNKYMVLPSRSPEPYEMSFLNQ